MRVPTRRFWDTLSAPWQACLSLAWEAYQAGSLPIGSVVADASGTVVAWGRNRIGEHEGEPPALFGHPLAHAEMNALVTFEYAKYARKECVLYTSTEPCPLCAGALGMSGLRRLHYASRDPWAGCAPMLETVPYLERKGFTVNGPHDSELERCLIALQTDAHLRVARESGLTRRFLDVWREVVPDGVRAGERLHAEGQLEVMAGRGAETPEVLEMLQQSVGSAARETENFTA